LTSKTLPVAALAFAAALAAPGVLAQIVFYEHDNFRGRTYSTDHSVSNFADTGFNDMASSMEIRGGRWEICQDAYFRGHCQAFGPGRYSSLGPQGFNDKVSSVRALGWTPDGEGGWGGQAPTYGNDRWGAGARAVLYAERNLAGQPFPVPSSGIANLDRTGFNDRARSLRVESGYWIFCSDANFQGDCHTYGPGDYPSLPSGQRHSISSGRQVSAKYPYQSTPNWSN
jgi:hypothetical protein